MANRTTTIYDNGEAVNPADELNSIATQIASNTKAALSGAGGGLTDAQLRASAVPVSQSTTTQVSAAKTAGQSVVVPIGAKEWTVSIWTGTATVNGAAGCPAGFSDGSDKANAATVTIAFDTPGTGYVRYAT